MSVKHTPEPDDTLHDADIDAELDEEGTEGHSARKVYVVGDAETSVNRDIDAQSSRPQ